MRFTAETTEVIVSAKRLADSVGDDRGGTLIKVEMILLALALVDSPARDILNDNGADAKAMLNIINADVAVLGDGFEEYEIQSALGKMRIESRKVIKVAAEVSERSGTGDIVTPEILLYAITRETSSTGYAVLRRLNANINGIVTDCALAVRDMVSGADSGDSDDEDDINDDSNRGPGLGHSGRRGKREKKDADALKQYGKNLTQMAKDGKIDPVIGREDEIMRVMQILVRRTKNNPCLVGDPGVGKTAIAEGLALKIVEGDVPDIIKGKTVYSIDMGTMIAGSKYRGDFEERIKNVLDAAASDPNIILFIDEIHTLVGTGAGENSLDAANIMKPMLTKNELQVIGATTHDEYSKYIEKDSALERRFQKVIVNEPSVSEAILILKGLRAKYEDHHKIHITDDAIEQAVMLSSRYISDRFLPDKAIDLIDEAAARKRINFDDADERKKLTERIREIEEAKLKAAAAQEFERASVLKDEQKQVQAKLDEIVARKQPDADGFTDVLTVDDIADVLSKWSGIPVSKITQTDAQKLKNLESELKSRVIGQDEAVTAIAKAIRRSRLGLKDPTKPSGSFIFLGTTGVGKTELAKALAEVMFGSENALVRIDMSEYMEKNDVNKLIGSPPGYVGYEEGGQLTEKIRRHPYSVVLFDEIEKAHPEIFNAMLQILDDGRLTDGKGRTVDFKNTIIIMTSNIGARMLTSGTRKIGFDFSDDKDEDEASREKLYGGKSYDEAKTVVIDELKKAFSPEFVNRVDEILFFRMLGRESLIRIVDLLVASVSRRISDMGINIVLTDAAKDLLAKKGYDPQYGARPLKRVIQSMVEDNFSEALLDGIICAGCTALIDADNDEIKISRMETQEDKSAVAAE